jgi:hypothetical protein
MWRESLSKRSSAGGAIAEVVAAAGAGPSAKPHSGQKRNSGLIEKPQLGHVCAVRVPHA